MDERFPRELKPVERELLLWILPGDRLGYNEYRRFIEQWKVVAQGRRGEGNYILAAQGEQPDNESPLPQVLTYGSVETAAGELSVSVREVLGHQVEFEIVSVHGAVDITSFEETRRWALSSWRPTQACPKCGLMTREVVMSSEKSRILVLAICSTDRRLWMYDESTGINHPIPVTNFYNELMLHKNIRDPNIALDAGRLFSRTSDFSDRELTHAFQTYNVLHTKIAFEGNIAVEEQSTGFSKLMKRMLGINQRQKS